ncbi:RecQ family ATP-dependent DNA helicase [Geminocystis sp. GBBB08]|uniref:RecQ family ATP-dependent DNA helicase n=1 Tax=Geminocystis sp. GBBB08 TaxID=2604140 RepID=UPI0027E313A9|nr:RecQ family ATP-dependent DNA helicase [Geminocystis sp. GBBB08]MBL1209984.1 ATP-dependent DNA helicase RecQ [Geminocystis sp. GBBB08]
MENKIPRLKDTLKKYWDYEDFRQPQEEIIKAILTGKDCLIVMPTGGGKSLCFQLPALLQEGLTLVISPLVALMENQVQELREKNLPAGILHSEVNKVDRKNTISALESQQLRLLYLSPETLFSPPIWEIISNPIIKINGLILDEAHCLAQWGESFRPAYRRLGTIRPFLLNYKPLDTKISITCFTATADVNTQKIIIESLQLSNPEKFLISPNRDNLKVQVKTIWTPRGRKQELIKYIERKNSESGLIYVRTRKDSEELANLLNKEGYDNQAYHGGLRSDIRRKVESDWLTERIKFVVCTCAFGMGINKSNLRWIFHYQAPLLLSEYIQEIGRGGRDGKLTEVITLISEASGWLNPEDKNRREYFLNQQIKLYQQAERFLREIPTEGNIEELSKKINNPNYQLYLSILNSSQQLRWIDPYNYHLTPSKTHQSIKLLINRQKKLIQQTHEYLTTKICRWSFLLSAFGFSPSTNFRCGKCDNCLKLIRN